MPVKIVEFTAENVKRIKAVQIVPATDGLTIIGGNNNQGKTSVLDGLAWALGGEKHRPAAAQRDGANTPPHLYVHLSNGLIVERKGKNGNLTVTDPSGKRGGQQILNEFVEQLALDLPKFMEMSDRKKADTLLQIIGVGDQLSVLEKEEKALYDRRTAIGQIAAQKKHYAEELPEYLDVPEEIISASELIQRQQEILARNGENQRKRVQAAQLEGQASMLQAKVKSLTEQLKEASAQYDQVMEEWEIARKSADELQDESTAELEESLNHIEFINSQIRSNMERQRAFDEAESYTAQYDDLTEKIKNKRDERLSLLKNADLPLPDLSVEDGALTYHGKKWTDMSGSDQLKVATAIVRKLNPDCGFVLLDKLEQMDLVTLKEFGDWLHAENLQAIATRVSTGGECQIIIEDGYVAGETTRPEPKAKQWTKGVF